MPAQLIVAPVAAGYPSAAGLRLGPERVVAALDVARGQLVYPDLGDGSAAAAVAAVATAAAAAVATGQVPYVIGGDHTVARGGIAGVQQGLRQRANRAGRGRDAPPLFVLWLDAHPDVNTEATSPTGNLHGMVLSGVLGEGPLAAVPVYDPLPARQVVLAGARSFDPGELAFLQARPDLVVWDVDVLRGDGWQPRVAALLRRVQQAGGALYVTLDLDVFDPAFAPGVAVPARHGALPEPVLALLRRLRESGCLAGADVVELYPPADRGGRTAQLAAAALEALGAARRLQRAIELPAAA